MLATFAGCAGGPGNLPYRAPDPGQASVDLTVRPAQYGPGRYESEVPNRHAAQCQPDRQGENRRMELARYVSRVQSQPAAVVALPVGRVDVKLVRTNNNESCGLKFSAQLEEGHAYAMKTQSRYSGLLPPGECLALMVDTRRGKPVQLTHESATPEVGPMCRKESVATASSKIRPR